MWHQRCLKSVTKAHILLKIENTREGASTCYTDLCMCCWTVPTRDCWHVQSWLEASSKLLLKPSKALERLLLRRSQSSWSDESHIFSISWKTRGDRDHSIEAGSQVNTDLRLCPEASETGLFPLHMRSNRTEQRPTGYSVALDRKQDIPCYLAPGSQSPVSSSSGSLTIQQKKKSVNMKKWPQTWKHRNG